MTRDYKCEYLEICPDIKELWSGTSYREKDLEDQFKNLCEVVISTGGCSKRDNFNKMQKALEPTW